MTLSGTRVARGLLWLWTASTALVVVLTLWLWWIGGTSEQVVDRRAIQRTQDRTLWVFSPDYVRSRSLASIPGDGLLPSEAGGFFFSEKVDPYGHFAFYEGDLPLGPQLSNRRAVEERLDGSYFPVKHLVYFSTSDGSNPRMNGRRYWFANDLRPRMELLPLLCLGALILLGISCSLFATFHREVVIQRYCRDGLEGRGFEYLISLGFAAVYTIYLFLAAALNTTRTIQFGLCLSLGALLILLLLRHKPTFGGTLWWILGFAVWYSLRGAIAFWSDEAWQAPGTLWVCLALGFLIYSAWHCVGSRVGPAGLPAFVAFFVLFASVRTLQNLGFGWKAMLARLSDWDWISRFDTTWNAKFNESWVLLAMWSLIAVALARRDSLGPRAAWLLAVSGAAVLMTGYSRTSQLAFLVGCIVFWLALKSPRHARTVTTAVLLALTLGAPIFGSLSWNWYLKNSSLVEVQPLLAQRLTPRLLVWGYTASMVGQRPVVGWGPGAADRSPARTLPAIEVWDEAVQLPESQRARQLLPGGHPHNAPLLIWFETGFIGILFLIGFLWSVMRNSYNCRGSSQLAAYLALVVSAFFIFWFNYPLLMPEPIFLLVAVCGIYAMASVSDVETPVVETRTPRLE